MPRLGRIPPASRSLRFPVPAVRDGVPGPVSTQGGREGPPSGTRAAPPASVPGRRPARTAGPEGQGPPAEHAPTLQDQDVTEAHAERGGAREEG